MKKILLFIMGCAYIISFAYAQQRHVKISPIKTTFPSTLATIYKQHFNRYIELVAPNKRAFYIVAQKRISDEQLRRSANIVGHYLTDYPNSVYGNNKAAIANQMANNQAVLALMNGSDNGENPISEQIMGQPLYEKEIQVEGGHWYMQQDYHHRDASFEEILHWIHDNGIGVDDADGTISQQGALPAYQREIRVAQKNALKNHLWGQKEPEWIAELRQENSLSQEYLAAVVDAYYGLWGAWQEEPNLSMWGIYSAKNRQAIKTKDSKGYQLMTKFFHPYLTYNARIDPDFDGVFSLKFNTNKPYTNHSRYLRNITLLGHNPVNVIVNELDNNISGNLANNTVVFSGKLSEYNIRQYSDYTIVTDKQPNRDGNNKLIGIERLQFSDAMQLNKILK